MLVGLTYEKRPQDLWKILSENGLATLLMTIVNMPHSDGRHHTLPRKRKGRLIFFSWIKDNYVYTVLAQGEGQE